MASTNEQILEEQVRHSIGLQRLAGGTVKDILALLAKVDTDIVAKMREYEIEGRSEAARRRLQRMLEAVREIIQEGHSELYPRLRDDMFELAKYEAEYQQNLLSSTVPVAIDVIKPSVEQLTAIVTQRPMQGLLLKDWAAGLESDKLKRVEQAINIGFAEGETIDDMVRRVRGTRAKQFRDGVLDISRRNAEAVVRTAVAHTAQSARDDLFAANADLIKAVAWNSTIDNRTCVVAGTMVMTPDGETPIESLTPGDKVIGGSGVIRSVLHTDTKKVSELMRVKLSNGVTILCTPDHMFRTESGNWLPAHMMMSGTKLSAKL